jgi:hypothetical protein
MIAESEFGEDIIKNGKTQSRQVLRIELLGKSYLIS